MLLYNTPFEYETWSIEICWDSIDILCYDKVSGLFFLKHPTNQNMNNRRRRYQEIECPICKETFLSYVKDKKKFCSVSCGAINTNKSHPRSQEWKDNISKGNKGKKRTEEQKASMSIERKNSERFKGSNNPMYGKGLSGNLNGMYGKGYLISGKNNPNYGNFNEKNSNWKGGVRDKNLPLYDTYVNKLEPYGHECRRNINDHSILEVKCTKCNNWYVPRRTDVRSRLSKLDLDQNRFYCSDACKQSCDIYHKSAICLMREHAFKAGRIFGLGREVQSQLRRLVFLRDDYTCQKCESKKNLQCHHIDPVKCNPIESADIDNCITLCYTCHKWIHINIEKCSTGYLANQKGEL
jgi:hypothetical protein